MITYKIGRIRIRNFKSIIEFDESFEKDLVILDGPNGFGKTTLFDALELIMFGRIKRIDEYKIVDQKQGYRDSLYVNEPSKDILIQVQFSTEQNADSFVVSKRLPKNSGKKKNAPIRDNSPIAWDRFETYITDHFVDHFEGLDQVAQEKIHEQLGVAHLMRAFHLFYYIQQEEKMFFLKSTEKERLNELSDLFDTKKEEKQRKQLDDVRKAIIKRLTTLDKEIPALQVSYDQKQQTQIQLAGNEVPYTTLFTKGTQPLWDTALEAVTHDFRTKCHEELNQIRDFVLHLSLFQSATFNKKLNAYLDNNKLMESTVVLFAFLSTNPAELREQYQRQNDYTKWIARLARNQIVNEIDKESTPDELIAIANTHQWSLNQQEMKDLIAQIRLQRKNSSALSDIVVGINETRDALHMKNKLFLKEVEDESNSECPMCGRNWVTIDALTQQLDSKKQMFERFYTDSANNVIQLTDELFAKHITIIRDGLGDYTRHPDNIVNASFFKQWEDVVKYQPQVEEFVQWCESQGYDLHPYANAQMHGIEQPQLELMVSKLREFLRSKRTNVEVDYHETSEKFKVFEDILRNLFDNDIAQVKKLTVERIDEKKTYVDGVYYRTNAKERAKLVKYLQGLLNEQRRLTEYRDKVSAILETYDTSIREHWSKIINDIEVIFYLYFAKVTQYYQRGLGMFIQQQRESDKEQDLAKGLRFVYKTSSDQDAINYLSSGQLSALVIAFTLALNRVYNRGLSVLLIDDPVQTMDDINMASLTELLRNDFSDMQIILSTHEDQVARYLKYKFLKYGLDSERINMKEKSLGLSKPSVDRELHLD